MHARYFLLGVTFLGFAGCSASSGSRVFGSGGATGAGAEATNADGARAAVVVGAGATSAGSPTFVVTDASTTWPLSAHVERDHVTVSLVTVACNGGCADVVAVATGGYPPYTFRWEDGTTTASRRVCPSTDSMYVVDVTDTGNDSGEIRRSAQTTRAFLDARVLRCPPDGGVPPPPPPPGELCIGNPSFEGTAQITEFGGFNAPPWVICDPPGSPDVRNASVGWTVPGEDPTDGSTYLEMLYLSQIWRETAGEPLCAPMTPGQQYSVQLDLSYQGLIEGSTPGRLEIWASQASCGEDQLLWTSPVAPHTWQTFCATFTAQQAFTYLQLKPADIGGGVLVDHMVPVARCPP